MPSRSTLIITLVTSLLLGARSASAQMALETVLLKNGTTITGEVVEFGEDRLVLARKSGKGSIRQTLRFERIAPQSLYAAMVSALSPLDGADHLRIAKTAYEAELFAVARRHFSSSVPEGAELGAELAAKVADCETRDLQYLLERSREAMDAEQFDRARSLALSVLRRYPDHELAKPVSDLITQISQRYEAVQRRRAAVARSKRDLQAWKRGEALIEDVDKWVMRARDAEVAGLAATEHFRTAKNRLDDATKYLGGAEKRAAGLRQSPLLPDGLRPRLAEIENEIIDLQVRTRLHVASLYTVRGSYGSALSYVNGALAYDPVNEQALAARARIEEAAAVSSLRGFGRLIR